MSKDEYKFRELLESQPSAGPGENARTPVTILFSDIKGSTPYFEKYGDVAGMAMVERSNRLLFPQIVTNSGRVVKTIGDGIMAVFHDPVAAVKAAVAMQRTLAADREGKTGDEQIQIRIGLHFGPGLLKENDVYGDVVNAAARVQGQAEPGQILITDVLLESAKAAGLQCAAFGKAEMKGKDEPIDIYAVAWSDSATQQLIEAIQARFDARMREAKSQYNELEREFDRSLEQWRAERRKLTGEIEELEESVEKARQSVRSQSSQALQAEIAFQLQESTHAREDAERQLAAAEARWNSERNTLRAQIAAMQAGVIEAMERSNNPARAGMTIREQVESRLADARQLWELEWQSERQRLNAEIERLKKQGGNSDERREAARLAVLKQLGKLPPRSSALTAKSADQLLQEFEAAKKEWENERERFLLQVKGLEIQARRVRETARAEAFQDLQAQFDPKLAAAQHERQRLEIELQSIKQQIKHERDRFAVRIAELEQAITEAQTATRTQTEAELEDRHQTKLQEAHRLRSRVERKLQDVSEELDSERRRNKRQIAQLEEQLKEARETAFKATRQFRK